MVIRDGRHVLEGGGILCEVRIVVLYIWFDVQYMSDYGLFFEIVH